MKKLLVLVVAACGAKPVPQPPPPPLGSDAAKPASSLPPTDVADRKHAFSTTPNELHWDGSTAKLDADTRLQKVQAGAAFDVTEGPAVVVAGTVTNEKGEQIVAWHQHAHRLMCRKDADCIVFVHAGAKAASADTRTTDLTWAAVDATRPQGPQAAQLWGDRATQPGGFLLKLQAGAPPYWHIHKHDYRGVVLVGTVVSYESGKQPRDLPAGSTWWQPGGNKHTTYCTGSSDCVVYMDFSGAFDIFPAN